MSDDRGFLVCPRTGFFADDVHAKCARCAAPIVHRPRADPELVKICLACVARQIASDGTEPEIRVTNDTLHEVALYNAKTRGIQ